MNELIKELAELSGAWEYFNSGDEKSEAMDKQALRNFAELVVKECANAIQAEKDTGLYNDQQLAGMTVSKAVIKNHFGVEE